VYSRILVPLDGSSLGEEVLPYVRQLSDRLSIPAELMAVIEPPTPSISRDLNPQRHEHETVAHRTGHAQNYLSRVAENLRADGLSVSISTPSGNPAAVIAAETEKQTETLIAMCGHGRSGLARGWLGSVTDRVLHMTSSPMLIVKSHRLDDPLRTKTGFSKIIVPLDGSPLAEQVLPHVEYLAMGLELTVDLVRVTPSRDEFYRYLPDLPGGRSPSYENYLEEAVEEATTYISEIEDSLRQKGVNSLEKHVLRGNPADSIIGIASETNDRLVAMTTHGRSGLGRWLLGSVADRVAVHTEGPVLVIRATGTASESSQA